MNPLRTLAELITTDDPGLPVVKEWAAGAKNRTEVLPVERAAGERALLALQVTSRSPMGAIALETGGLLIDEGWVRVLGGGHPRLPRAIHEWNGMIPGSATHRLPMAVLVGDDAMGGFFALNGSALEGGAGHVFYYSPTSLKWEDVAPSYSEWLVGMMNGDLDRFYQGMRWPGWEAEVRSLAGDRAFSVYPFLFAEGPDVAERSRRAVPTHELWSLYAEDLPRQLTSE